tara:strand:+ start:572 stop:979 length:408 start_codon:yes stop_codon:yes gene_type:complete
MKVTKISAITIFTKNMKNSCQFYSSIPKFELTYGGPDTNFSTFRINESPEMFLNIELQEQIIDKTKSVDNEHFRIIFHTDDVDALYYYLRNDDSFSRLGKFETKPTDAEWEERFFQVRDPDGHPIVFATPISKND